MKLIPEYIGDSVYCIYDPDNGSFILRLNHHENETGQIVLEPSVMEALDRFRGRIRSAESLKELLGKFHHGMPVLYVPNHVEPGNHDHPDCEQGIVSSKNHLFVFVKFPRENDERSLEEITSQACDPSNLVILPIEKGEDVE